MAEDKDDLQFERAEYAATPAPAAACAACGQNLWSVYYDVNGKATCERCKADFELQRSQGSGFGRFARAALYGAGAGALGAGIWYGIRALTKGYEFGLIAIVVGLMVGAAVKAGCRGRGGWLYQGLAVFLTYTSIVSTYVPDIVTGLRDKWKESQQASPGPDATASPAAAPASPAPAPASPPPGAADVAAETPSLGRALIGLAILVLLVFAIAFAAPFLAGFQNVLGLLIIGFGLWEAWKINRATPLTITGPYRVGAAPPPPAAPSA